MAIGERSYSVDDLWALSRDDGRFELSEGRLIEMSPSGGEHGDLASEMNMRIRLLVKQKRLGHVTAAETGYILHRGADGKDTVRAPDVGFISLARWPGKLPKGYIPAAPDLAVEIVSPNDKAEEVQRKVAEYLKYGTRMVWVLYPATRSIVVHTAEGALTLGEEDTLDGGDVLPGFNVGVKEIFED